MAAGLPTWRAPTTASAGSCYVRAIDALTGKKVWDYEQISSFHYGPGLLSTAGGLIFAPEQQGMFTVLDAKTGKALWNFNTGALITVGAHRPTGSMVINTSRLRRSRT